MRNRRKDFIGLSGRPFRKPAILLISQNEYDKIKSSRPRNLFLPSRKNREFCKSLSMGKEFTDL
jgi:hypothetical protein